MKKSLMILIIALVALGTVAFSIKQNFHKVDDTTIALVVLDKWANQSYSKTTSLSIDEITYDIEVTYVDDLNHLLSEEPDATQTIYIFDAFAFLEYKDKFEDYSIFALRPKSVDLLVSPKYTNTTKLNEIKGAVLGISSLTADAYLFKSVVDKEGILGVSIDEVKVNNPYEKMTLLLDNYIQYAFLESPYRELANAKGAKSLYTFDNGLDAFVVPITTDDDVIAIYNKIIDSINVDITTKKASSEKPLSLTDTIDFSLVKGQINDDSRIFEIPSTDDINRVVTYFFITNRIDVKYKYEEIVQEGFR